MEAVGPRGNDVGYEGCDSEGIVVDLFDYEPLLSMEGLGQALRCEPRTPRRWVDRDRPLFTTRGGAVLVSRSLVQRRLEERMRAERRAEKDDR